ncbi:AbrB family transcriptional regulator [Salipiger sp. PrR002]|uniref:AbrB family transcriptional regulator n=1 Tax=Salipiger sp. PrR002 TaxID=2706489 RepID=UPI0013BC3946|nr:AbrB family transcriptional regulator [Salipiger sp. PrR002]NDW01884.1 AbrB family transcriptional regulator [Salipiger sp. PrR002]NDW59086.1 AbrB family transcriptional regulator [Salipiger sp. PrR004]
MTLPSGLLRTSLTVLVAGAAGAALDRLGVPLGWLLGAMLTMIAAAFLRLPAEQPRPLVPWVKASVGTLLGASVTPSIVTGAAQWWPSVLCMFIVIVLGGLINFQLLSRVARFSKVEATLCSMPGGITEMILLGEQAGADQRRVAVVHTLRIALSILTIPILATLIFGITIDRAGAPEHAPMTLADWGWFAACILAGVLADRHTRVPAPLILVPLVLCAALHLSGLTAFVVPGAVSTLIQLVIGMNVGARFLGLSLRSLAAMAGAACSVVAVQISLAVAASLLMSGWIGADRLSLMLAYAPGGLAEMSLIAIAMGREVAFVGLHHVLRVLLSLGASSPLVRRASR